MENLGNTIVFTDLGDEEIYTMVIHNFYQVTENFPFDTSFPFFFDDGFDFYSDYYSAIGNNRFGWGLGHLVWHSSFQYEETSDGFYCGQAFRMIGQEENNY